MDEMNRQPRFEVKLAGRVYSARLALNPSAEVLVGDDVSRDLGLPAPKPNEHGTGDTPYELSIGGVTLKRAAVTTTASKSVQVSLGIPFMRKVRVWLSNSSRTLIVGVPDP